MMRGWLAAGLLTAVLLCCPQPGSAASKKAAPKTKPKQSLGMGPLVRALGIARAQWQKDACVAAFRYRQLYPAADFAADPQDFALTEEFSYDFYSPTAWRDTFQVNCLGARPPEAEVREKRSYNACIADVDVDLDRVLRIAAKRGVSMDTSQEERGLTREMRLLALPEGTVFLDWIESLDLDKKGRAALRRYEGKTLWLALSEPDGRTLFIDPATGAVVLDPPRYIERSW